MIWVKSKQIIFLCFVARHPLHERRINVVASEITGFKLFVQNLVQVIIKTDIKGGLKYSLTRGDKANENTICIFRYIIEVHQKYMFNKNEK